MISRISPFLRVGSVQQTPPASQVAATESQRLQFLQTKDLFFSSNSVRALASWFLKQKIEANASDIPKAFVLRYVSPAQSQKNLWTMAFPSQERTVVLAAPYWEAKPTCPTSS